jgi:hypothetical protein
MADLAASIRAELDIKHPDISEITDITLKQHEVVLTTPEGKLSITDMVDYYVVFTDTKIFPEHLALVSTVDEIINILQLGRPYNSRSEVAGLIVVTFVSLFMIRVLISEPIDYIRAFAAILYVLMPILLAIIFLYSPENRYKLRLRRLLSRRKYVKNSALPIPIRNEILAYL